MILENPDKISMEETEKPGIETPRFSNSDKNYFLLLVVKEVKLSFFPTWELAKAFPFCAVPVMCISIFYLHITEGNTFEEFITTFAFFPSLKHEQLRVSLHAGTNVYLTLTSHCTNN